MKLTLSLPGRAQWPFDTPSGRRAAAMPDFLVEAFRNPPWRTVAAKAKRR